MVSIHEAARAGDGPAVLLSLAENPASINARDGHSRTPLHLASWAGQAEIARILCAKHADVGAAAADDMAAIHFASQKGHAQVVRILLGAGASVNSRTRKGMTPLHYSIQGNHQEVAKLLIKKGASLDAPNKQGKTPMDLAKDEHLQEILLAAQTEKNEPGVSQIRESTLSPSDSTMLPVPKEIETTTTLKCSESEEGISDAKTDNETKGSILPRRKKPKVQLSHLATDQESDGKDEENG